MESTISSAGADPQLVWWQGSLFSIKARADQTDGALGLVEVIFSEGMAPPLHVHHREDEAFYVLEGQIRFRRGDQEFTGGAGDFVFGPRGTPHSFKVLAGGARALVFMTPAGLENMFVEGGVPARQGMEPPAAGYDMKRVAALAAKYGWDVLGPPLA